MAVLVSRLSDDVSEGDTVSDFIKRAMKRLGVLTDNITKPLN